MIDKLRDEIIESQKARTDLMKWKLVLAAATGAAGFGTGSNVPQGSHPPFVLLALIPFICLYVDAVCFHNEIRIMTIARFLRTRDKHSVEREYEEYYKKYRSYFSLEGFALLITTLGLSGLVFFVGYSEEFKKLIPLAPARDDFGWTVLKWAGGIGAAAGLLFDYLYRYQRRSLDRP